MKNKSRRTRSQKKFNKRIFAIAAFTTMIASVVFSITLLTDTYTIVDGNEKVVVKTIGADPAEALQKANIAITADDTVEVTEITGAEKTINITRAYDVAVEKDGKTKYVKMSNGTVSDALVKSETTLDSNDSLSESKDQEVAPGMVITVENIDYTFITETKAIPYDTKETATAELLVGTEKVVTEGNEGVQKLTYRQKIVDGDVKTKELVSTVVEEQPVAEEVLIGTQQPKPEVKTEAAATLQADVPAPSAKSAPVVEPAPVTDTTTEGTPYESIEAWSTLAPSQSFTLDTNGVPTNYSQKISGPATAYTAGPGAVTSTGKKPQLGYVAVDPDVIPYGTKLYIRSTDGKYIYGYAIAADTGGFTNGSTVVDLYFDSESDCYSFGRRAVDIYVLE